MSANLTYEFGPYVLDPDERQLLRNGVPIALAPMAFETLVELVKRSGHLVQRAELMQTLWPDSFVEDANLSQYVWTLRKLLGDGADGGSLIETVPKRGYRFVASVRAVSIGESRSRMTLAVLPFKAIDANAEDQYLGPVLADALITRLSQIRQIIVWPTRTLLKYDASVQEPLDIGRLLGVDSVLAGHVQRSGEHIRVTVQLINIADGTLLWAAKFDHQFTDIFAYEDSISEQVTKALQLKLGEAETRRSARRHTENDNGYKELFERSLLLEQAR